MISKTIFRKAEHLHNRLTDELEKIKRENSNSLRISELSLFKIDEAVKKLKALIVDFDFDCAADEIHFFKNIKPLFISKFIYHSTVIKILMYQPAAGDEAQRNYFMKEIDKLTAYYNENAEFYSYYRRDATFLDQKYFRRGMYDLKMTLPSDLYDYDEGFTTSHDIKVAYIISNEYLEAFLLNTINNIGQLHAGNAFQFPLVWSSSKVALVELLYALHHTRCFNGGNIEFSEVVKATERLFKIDLGNSYKTIGEIRSRKNGRTKFLQSLNDNLNQLFLDGDQ
ncbi:MULTISPECIES: RteC domain-containing protein [Chryseobacterium]|uniref:RteC protein n=1 Tax=Candidatus Chryseobacterium massiliense TaxID=204089 RepID=A0A3D9BAB7_9FLAO|nr:MULTISPECIES: RteC domain-containing protein [Chryseobacterium]REC50624.1 RteC protein [Candidatus Chryseobacterium massiliae]